MCFRFFFTLISILSYQRNSFGILRVDDHVHDRTQTEKLMLNIHGLVRIVDNAGKKNIEQLTG